MIPIEQEPDRVPRGLVRISAAAVAIAIAASVGAVLLLARGVVGEVVRVDPRPPARIDVQLFDLPTEAERLQRRAEARLQRYGWIDRGRGIVHVPLDVAIELYLQERAP
jgi:hypothetical protein